MQRDTGEEAQWNNQGFASDTDLDEVEYAKNYLKCELLQEVTN